MLTTGTTTPCGSCSLRIAPHTTPSLWSHTPASATTGTTLPSGCRLCLALRTHLSSSRGPKRALVPVPVHLLTVAAFSVRFHHNFPLVVCLVVVAHMTTTPCGSSRPRLALLPHHPIWWSWASAWVQHHTCWGSLPSAYI